MQIYTLVRSLTRMYIRYASVDRAKITDLWLLWPLFSHCKRAYAQERDPNDRVFLPQTRDAAAGGHAFR